MTDFISDFINKAVKAGITPKDTKDIIETDGFKRISCVTDKRGKKSISYWLKIEHDFSYGYIHDFKHGVEIKYFSHNKDVSKSDLTRIKKMMAIRKAEEKARMLERHQKIAVRANLIWSQSSKVGKHQYLDKKAVSLSPARIKGNAIIVPMYDDPENMEMLVNWQRIMPDGDKRFPFGGLKKGAFCQLTPEINPNKKIVICEGFATGKTIKASGAENVVVAFDAGNMLHVAKKYRKVYKTTPIVIGADNDESGTGEKEALECQNKITNCSYVMPSALGCDFNDCPEEALNIFGGNIIPSQEEELNSNAQEPTLPVPTTHNYNLPTDYDWQDHLTLDKNKKMVSSSVNNAILYLDNHTHFRDIFAYNEFSHEEMVVKCPPWEDPYNFKVKPVDDLTITMCCATLEKHGISIGFDKCAKAISVSCWENRFHPARDYLETLEWDGVERLGTMFKKYFHVHMESDPYLKMIGRKWFTAMVKRLFEPACKFDHVLVLESQKQGVFKSTSLKVLTTFNGETFCTDSVSVADHSNKDAIQKMQGNIILELAELTGFNSQDDNAIKNWITQQEDIARLAYGRKLSKFKRQFVFVATTNDYDYLKDPTGNRRYWPVTVGGFIDIDGLKEVREQLWAEAVWLYKKGYYIGVTNGDNELCEIERSKRLVSDAWDYNVMYAVRQLNKKEFTIDMIMEEMNLKMWEKNDKSKRRIAKILRMNGWDNRPKWDKKNKKAIRLWGHYVDEFEVGLVK